MSEKNPRELYKERNQRVTDAITLKEPDRVPITPMVTFYHTEVLGISKKEAMYDLQKLYNAAKEIIIPMNWDQAPPLFHVYSGELFDALGMQVYKWPGASSEEHRLEDNRPFQFFEREYMKDDEYEELFSDPTGFALRKILPRHLLKFKGFSGFPPFTGLVNATMAQFFVPFLFGSPDGQKMLKAAQESVSQLFKIVGISNEYEKVMKKNGYPMQFLSATQSPYDIVSEFMRGMTGTMMDMYKKPEELKKLLDIMTESTIKATTQLAMLGSSKKVIFIPLHRGAEGFMNFKQFETFYWPQLTKLMEGLIKHNFIPMPFFEGKYTDRFEYLAEFAKKYKGKMIYWFDKSDIINGKEIFGDYACIRGNVPASLLITGTPQQVEDHVKKLIE
ncbi:MAG: uroporphyrinogen decarboxylase family protein, partial [Promethearchaeota archaeon]